MNKTIPAIIILIFFAVFCSCIQKVRHSDCATTFSIKGKFIDSESNLSIEKVQVYFLGKGLHIEKDMLKEVEPKIIGASDSEGNINLEYKYFWSKEEKQLSDGSWERIDGLEETFDVIILKEGYADTRVHFILSELPYKENITYVKLNNILLKRDL